MDNDQSQNKNRHSLWKENILAPCTIHHWFKQGDYPSDGFRLFAPFGMIVLYLWGFFLVLSAIIPWLDPYHVMSKFGAMGDTFGMLNSLFTGLALAAVIVGIFLQSRELKQAMNEFAAISQTSQTQAFDSTFFNTLQLLQKLQDGAHDEPILRQDGTLQYFGAVTFSKYIQKTLAILNTDNVRSNQVKKTYLITQICTNPQTSIHQYLWILDLLGGAIQEKAPSNKEHYWKILEASLTLNERNLLATLHETHGNIPFMEGLKELQERLLKPLTILQEAKNNRTPPTPTKEG